MFCSKCGTELKKDDNFCSKCGQPVDGNKDSSNENNKFDLSQFNGNAIQACKYLCDTYHFDLAEAKQVVDGKCSIEEMINKKNNSNGANYFHTKFCCPKCKSTNIEVLGNKRKGFSVGKAIGGAILTGGIGTLAGFAGGEGKYEVFCKDCGYRWKTK